MPAAEKLRAAATKLRTAAQAAGGASWTADHYPEGTVVHPTDSTHSLLRLAADGRKAVGTPHVTPAVGTHMALMDPAVGLALAELLDSAAIDAEQIGPDHRAVAVAQQILSGGES